MIAGMRCPGDQDIILRINPNGWLRYFSAGVQIDQLIIIPGKRTVGINPL